MGPLIAHVRNAERMMTRASAVEEGVRLAFADGCSGLIPFSDIPEVGGRSGLAAIELPNPFQINLSNSKGETIELPWDFGRHYCDPSYRPRVEGFAAAGTQALGKRIRELREAAGMTQGRLAAAAGIGRITLVRIENGEQSPRYGTLAAVAQAFGRPVAEIMYSET